MDSIASASHCKRRCRRTPVSSRATEPRSSVALCSTIIPHNGGYAERARALLSPQTSRPRERNNNEKSSDLAPFRSGRHRRRRRAQPDRIPGARRGELEEIRRHQARGDPRQGSARRQPAEEHQGIHRSHRHPGRIRADPGAAAAPEGRDRARFRQAELRRHPPQLSRAEAAVREGRLARRHLRLHEGPEADRARPRRERFLGRRPAIRQERQGPDAVAAVVGRLLHPLLQQGAVPEEGRRRSRRPSTRWSRPPRSSPTPRKAPSASSGAACATPT